MLTFVKIIIIIRRRRIMTCNVPIPNNRQFKATWKIARSIDLDLYVFAVDILMYVLPSQRRRVAEESRKTKKKTHLLTNERENKPHCGQPQRNKDICRNNQCRMQRLTTDLSPSCGERMLSSFSLSIQKSLKNITKNELGKGRSPVVSCPPLVFILMNNYSYVP